MTQHGHVDRWTIADAAAATGWALHGDGTVELGAPWVDTRTLPEGAMFAALASRDGVRHGAPHWDDARRRGACAVLFGSEADEHVVSAAIASGLPVIVADVDGWRALGLLARAWRRRCGFTVIGITGSSGKTSTKDLLASLLDGRVRIVASLANRNNELGVPITLLEADADTEVVICEMGMRALGEIAYLCEIAEPDISILTVAGTAHLELLGSVEAIASAKAEIIAGTRPDGVAIIPGWQRAIVDRASRVPATVVHFGEQSGAELRIVEVRRTHAGIAGVLAFDGVEHAFDLPVRGVHQARNLAAAVAAAQVVIGDAGALDLALEHVAVSSGRGDWHILDDGTLVIDDAYNANPESMDAALVELAAVSTHARRIAVLGYMAELGQGEPALHRDLGRRAAQMDAIDALVVVATRPAAHDIAHGWNEVRPDARARVIESQEEALARVGEWARPGDAVLVKASNSVGLGRIAGAIVESGAVPTMHGRSPRQ